MKNCSLSNRIVPPARQSRRGFTNGSAENLGTKLLYGHNSTSEKPVIARRNHRPRCNRPRPTKESFFHDQPHAAWGGGSCFNGVAADVEYVYSNERIEQNVI